MLATVSPFPQYFDLQGTPLDAGYLYFGQVGQNPETAPVTVYWDAAATQPAAQPIRTINGVVMRAGTPAILYAPNGYSLMVRDQSGRQILYAANSQQFYDAAGLASTTDPAGGAGMVGFAYAIAYGAGTIGKWLKDLALSAGSGFIGHSDSTTYTTNTVGEALNRVRVIVGGGGVADDSVRMQAALDAMTAGQTLKFVGVWGTGLEVFHNVSDTVLDFRSAKWMQNGGTDGRGLWVGKITDKATRPENITILGGSFYPAGDAAAYPIANWNPIAVVCGKNIKVVSPRIFPKGSTRAISIQTDNTWGPGGGVPAIDGVYVTDLQVDGDGNAADGVDIGSTGVDNYIRNVHVQGQVRGCKRGLHVYSGGDAYVNTNIHVDLTVADATVAVAEVARVTGGSLKLRAVGATALGADLVQVIDYAYDIDIRGAGGSLTTGVMVRETAGSTSGVSGKIKLTTDAGVKWTTGVMPQSQDAVYEVIEVDGATTGVSVSGVRSTYGPVTLKNCTTPVNNLLQVTDRWLGGVVTQGTGQNPIIIKRDHETADGSTERYGIDVANTVQITIANGTTALPFGASALFSGMLVINGTAGTGAVAMAVMGGGACVIASSSIASVFSSASGTAGHVNVYYNGSSQVEVQNNFGVSVTLRMFAIRTRNSP